MRVAGLVASRDDGVLRVATLLENRRFHGEAQALGSNHLTAMNERVALDLGAPQDLFGGAEADGAEPVAFPDLGVETAPGDPNGPDVEADQAAE